MKHINEKPSRLANDLRKELLRDIKIASKQLDQGKGVTHAIARACALQTLSRLSSKIFVVMFLVGFIFSGCNSSSRVETKSKDTSANYDPRNDPANFPKLKNTAE